MKKKILVLMMGLLIVVGSLSLAGCNYCDHQFIDEVVAPTCTQRGYTTHTCTICKIIITDSYVNATGHAYADEYTVVKPTCLDKGYTIYKCLNCGEGVKSDFTSALGHDLSVKHVIREANCTQTGLVESSCSRCGERENVTTEALGHDYENIGEANGYYLQKCGRCGDQNKQPITYTITYQLNGGEATNPTQYTVESETFTLNAPVKEDIAFLGWTWEGQTTPVMQVTIEKGSTGNRVYKANWHTGTCIYHVLNGVQITTDTIDSSTPGIIEFSGENATCAKNGQGMYFCEVCSQAQLVTTTAAHQLDFDNVLEYTDEPSCTQAGSGKVYCTVCKQYVESDVPALGHDYDSELVTEGQTVTLVLVCSVCGDRQQSLIENCTDYRPATCKTEGSVTYEYVTEDGEKLSLTLTTEKTPHVLNGVYMGDVVLAGTNDLSEFADYLATCTQNGMGMYTCECCDKPIFVTTYKPHTLDESTKQITKQPTCTQAGNATGHCTECNQDVEVELPATGHDYKYEITTAPTQSKVGAVTVTCGVDGCEFSVECYLPKLDYEGYEVSTLEDGKVCYELKLYEYGLTVYFIA